MMQAFQADIAGTDTDCYYAASTTGDSLLELFDLSNVANYASGSFNPSDFLNLG